MHDSSIIDHGRDVVRIEAEALATLSRRLDASFAEAVRLIYASSGRLIVSGIGKSGLIARKIVATMNSTGTPSIYLHPADAIHGDLGMVRSEDVVLLLSKSGNTEELKHILPIFRRIGVKVISILGAIPSPLAEQSDIILDGSVTEEACPHNLAPTASTTVALALGDALAVALLKLRDFTPEDFALYHPGGILGKRLLLRIEELMTQGEQVPIVHQAVPLKDAILEITSKRLGATCVVDDDGHLVGVITDGDLRRLLERDTDMTHLLAVDVMSTRPKTAPVTILASTALTLMEQYKITQLIIVDGERKPAGIVHMHDLVQLGLG
ncbi:MAG TPA: KpsF/GutQ family sugar-phosphate isomerase [Bacteroidota bacterium]|nr:KpsF/GutQ family sugar-phosphate isomerase [Bacteroidota bacterium]